MDLHLQGVSFPQQGATKLSLQTHTGVERVVDKTDIEPISENYKLCCVNARQVGWYMGESVTVYSLGKGKAKRYSFRLENDPREVSEWMKVEKVFPNRPKRPKRL